MYLTRIVVDLIKEQFSIYLPIRSVYNPNKNSNKVGFSRIEQSLTCNTIRHKKNNQNEKKEQEIFEL